jgi:hypothetical protein
MTKFSYHPEPGVSDKTEQFGVQFADGKPSEVTDEKAIEILRGNPFFKAVKAEKSSEPAKPAAQKATKPEADPNALKAVHIAGGRFVIKKGDEVLKEGLNKADADAFNALSPEDKIELLD